MSKDQIEEIFGNKIRVRVMGFLLKGEKLLMINHQNLNDSNEFWLPPGGGVAFGESAADALVREIEEETNLIVEVKGFVTAGEYIYRPLHAVELFFLLEVKRGEVKVGFDPELVDNQIINEISFLSLTEIKKKGKGKYHPLFEQLNSFQDLLSTSNLLLFDNNR